MKARLTTVLSLAGVLVAGSAAALVNTQVLRPIAPASADRMTAGPTDQPYVDTTAATNAEPIMVPATQATYLVDGAGSVTLDVSGNVLTIVSVRHGVGWTVVTATNSDATTVVVGLRSGNTLVEFHAGLLFGVVNTSVVTSDLAAAGTTTPRRHNSSTATTERRTHSADDTPGGDDEPSVTEKDD